MPRRRTAGPARASARETGGNQPPIRRNYGQFVLESTSPTPRDDRVGAGQFPWRQRATQLWHCLRRPHDARVDVHERIASRVYRRLRQRHIQLQVAEREASEYLAHRAWEQDYAHAHSKAISGDGAATSPWPSRKREERSSSNRNHISKHPDAIAYRLATADLFVEKAIAYLEEHAASYKPRANSVHATPIIILLFVTPHAIMRERNGAGIVEMTHQLITMGGACRRLEPRAFTWRKQNLQ